MHERGYMLTLNLGDPAWGDARDERRFLESTSGLVAYLRQQGLGIMGSSNACGNWPERLLVVQNGAPAGTDIRALVAAYKKTHPDVPYNLCEGYVPVTDSFLIKPSS